MGALGNATEEERRRAHDRQRTAAADGRRPPHGCEDAEGEKGCPGGARAHHRCGAGRGMVGGGLERR